MLSALKGRGTATSPKPRYLAEAREDFDDGWDSLDPVPSAIKTVVSDEIARSIISRNQSPDVPFDRSINPYRGCEHGCVYCYARPTHAYLDLSPGLDFESRLFAKTNAAELLRQELNKLGYECKPIALGANTDPYQPIERKRKISRAIIEVLAEFNHPLTIVTKSSLVERDLDLLAPMAAKNLVQVLVSITTLDRYLARHMEPRATAPQKRLEALRNISAAGVPVGVLFAPVIPFLNDQDLEKVLAASAEAGARSAGYVMLRLPHELKDLFTEWLATHEPMKAKHIMNAIRDLRGGKDNDPNFNTRMSGTGVYAELIRRRFAHACKKNGLNTLRLEMDCSLFKPPARAGDQLSLF